METQHNNRRMTGFNFKVSSYRCIILYNLLSPHHHNRLHSSQKAVALWLTTFVTVLAVAVRSCNWAGPDVQSHMSFLAPAVLCNDLQICVQNGMVGARHGHGTACVNQTRPHCINQMGTTQSKSLAARHGMCELASTRLLYAGWQRHCPVPLRYQYCQQTESGDHQLISCFPVF